MSNWLKNDGNKIWKKLHMIIEKILNKWQNGENSSYERSYIWDPGQDEDQKEEEDE